MRQGTHVPREGVGRHLLKRAFESFAFVPWGARDTLGRAL
jgi:hypothetical protein